MALATATAKNTLANAYANAAKFAALYSTVPGATPGTEVSTPRVPITWSNAVGGTVTATVTFNVSAGTTLRGWGVHTADTAGYLDGAGLAEQAFASAGKYTLSLTYTAA